MASNDNNSRHAGPTPLDQVLGAIDAKTELEWENIQDSPLHDSANHVRGYSNDFVDDEEVELMDEDGYETSSNSSWLPSSDDEISKLTRDLGVPLMENAGVFEPAANVEWDHLASWVKEHSIFLQAALDLLQERDKHAPTVGMMGPVILKAGPLKKASFLMKGIWKVKYVEIRRGMLSYYENLQNEDKLIRKDVPLQAHDCTVRAVKVHPSKAALQLTTNRRGGAIFELVVGNAKRLWMASSRDERQSWMQAIRNATVGGSLTTSNDHSDHRGRLRVVNPRSPFRHDLRLYLKTQSILRSAITQAEYIHGLLQQCKERASLLIPVKWIAKEQELLLQQQLQQSNSNFQPMSSNGDVPLADGQQAFSEEEVDRSIEQLWKDLQRDSVSINGKVYRGDQGLGPQGIMGALAHSILQVSLTPSPSSMVISPPPPPLSPSSGTELQKTPKLSDDEAKKSFSFSKKSDDENRKSSSTKKSGTDEEVRKPVPKKTNSDEQRHKPVPKGSDRASDPESDSQNTRSHGEGADSAPDSPASTAPRLTPPAPLSPAGRATSEVGTRWSDFSEAQALTYARDILLSGNRTRSGGDSYFCINTLFQNPELVVVVPSYGEVDPVKFVVTSDEAAIRRNDKAAWIKCRSKLQRGWKKLFCVLSEGVLSCYERALPRPNGLRYQLNMFDAIVSVTKKETKVKNDRTGEKARPFYAVSISTKDGKERTLAFDSLDRMLDWVYALESMAKANKSGVAGDSSNRRLIRRRTSESSAETQAQAGPSAEQATENHAAALGMDLEKVRERLAILSRKASPSVRVSVDASTEYKVSTTDPEGDDSKDTWAVVRTSFQQSFRLTGGPGGRIMRGEEVVRVTIASFRSEDIEAQEIDEPPPSPRRNRKKSLFRGFSANDEDQPAPLVTEDLNSSKTNLTLDN